MILLLKILELNDLRSIIWTLHVMNFERGEIASDNPAWSH